MHFHFGFTTVEVLWTLTFAAQLVLLVVLFGRERVRRFKWFTATIILMGLRLLTSRVLHNRLAPLPYSAILIALSDLAVITGLMVLVELARQAFAGVQRRTWIAWTLVLAAVGGTVLDFWGPWPSWKTLTANSQLVALNLMQLAWQKGDLLVGVLTVALGLLVVLFGHRYNAGWRSHTQQIMIGLSTAAIAQLGVQGIQQIVVRTVVPRTQAELDQARGLLERLYNANSVVYLVVVVWWIACLWIDEPGTAAAPAELPAADAAAVDSLTEAQAGEEAAETIDRPVGVEMVELPKPDEPLPEEITEVNDR